MTIVESLTLRESLERQRRRVKGLTTVSPVKTRTGIEHGIPAFRYFQTGRPAKADLTWQPLPLIPSGHRTMRRLLLPLLLLGFASGCCCCSSTKTNPYKPPLNCLGSAYDGSSSPCYHPPGPFWCCLPGPCSTCRDPYLHFYEEEHANWIGRHVARPNYALEEGADDE